MADHFGSQKLCATCVYWIGRRDVDLYGSKVTNCDQEGRCAIPSGPHRNTQRQANFCACSRYEKWPVLR